MTDDATISAEELGAEVRASVARLYRRLRSEKGGETLGDTQVSVLYALVKEGPRTLSELSEREHVTAPSMNQTVNSLQAAGFVNRQKDPSDGRKILIAATEEGRTVALGVKRHRHQWFDGHLENLSQEQRAAMMETARIFRTIADS
jgi:DNA-binding MarR family transcriptional regulator